jgi:uncharacterized membrane protein YfcA
MEHLPLFLFLAFVAEVLGTIGGFGSSLFFVPLASYFFDFHSVLGITASFHVISNLTKIGFFRKGANWRLIFTMGIPALIFVLAGAYLSRFVSTKRFEILLAVFLISISALLFALRNVTIKPTTTNAIAGGVFSGLIAGLLGTGGAIRGLVLSAFNLHKDAFIATSAIIDLAVDVGRTGIYFYNGYIHQGLYILLPMLLLVSVIGTYAGKRILERISEQQFKWIVLSLVFLTGVFNLINGIMKH